MDTSETYIKMMLNAWGDLKDDMPIGSLLFSRNLRMLYILDGKLVRWREKVNTSNCGQAIPLLEQDQLQGMIGEYPDHLWDFAKFIFPTIAPFSGEWQEKEGGSCSMSNEKLYYYRKFTSMEQLWLAFVMKKKYGKTWNGGNWE